MNRPPPPSDADRELNGLRARAYGRDHDIEADPAALARLVELENARVADTAAQPDTEEHTPAADARDTVPARAAPEEDPAMPAGPAAPATPAVDGAPTVSSPGGFWRSLWRRATATRSRRISFLAAAVVAVAMVGYAVRWLDATIPDATLPPLPDAADPALIEIMRARGLDGHFSTLQKYEPDRELEPWSVMHPEGYLCLLAVDRARETVQNAQCVPPGTELFVNLGAWPSFNDAYAEGLPDGSVIRWHLREDAVDVFVYPAS